MKASEIGHGSPWEEGKRKSKRNGEEAARALHWQSMEEKNVVKNKIKI